jgi:hypothetical protein
MEETMKRLITLALVVLMISIAVAYQIDVHVSGYEYENLSGEVLARFGSGPYEASYIGYHGNGTYPTTPVYWSCPQTVTGLVSIGNNLHFSNTGPCNAPQVSDVYITIPNPFTEPEDQDPTIPPNQ